ncbi:MAG: hypothetical protein HXL41_06820 [Solobacterium sp.]|nr:hypothetical protein [Solobacterium sp.]
MDTLEREKEIDLLERECCPFKEGDEYWVLNGDGSVSKLEWDNHSIDQSVLMLGNAFHTSKEAILEADRRVLLHYFKMFRDKCNCEWEADFEDVERKYFLILNAESKNILVANSAFYDYFNIFGYFKNESDAIKAIELFGDEIKRLYVEV